MKDTNPTVIAGEIKIGVAGWSIEEIRRLIDQIRDACKTNDYKLEVNFSGEFFNIPCN